MIEYENVYSFNYVKSIHVIKLDKLGNSLTLAIQLGIFLIDQSWDASTKGEK